MEVFATQTGPGDIGFYYSKGSPIDLVVKLRTGSDIVHVSIFSSASWTIAATSSGITEQPAGNEHRIWRPDNGFTPRVSDAMTWLITQKGQPYGMADIANQLLLMFSKNPVLLDKSADCSDLATKFLWIAGVPLPPELINTNRVTPGGLFFALFGQKE